MGIEGLIAIFFVFITVLFAAFAFFFPEWVGIQGKKAEEIEKSHRGDQSSSP